MPLLRRCLLAFLLLLAAPLAAQSGAADWLTRGSDIPIDPAWQAGTLPNGLHYVVRRNALPAHQVSIRIRIDAGSLNEAEKERGWAHFIEHLAFRGTKSFEDREARHIWQQLGASFGSDTNANTDPSQTVYQLDLPRADEASLDQSLAILSEMVHSARIDPAAVDAERKIVLAEKERRSEIATRFDEAARPLFYSGLKYAQRDPIGTEATLAAATPQGLRSFYDRWYRPERATVIVVGDADPAMMTRLVARHFGGWQARGPAPARPDYGRISGARSAVATLVYPGAPYTAQIVWVRPHNEGPDTVERERREFAERLAAQILNRRLEAKARGEATFVGSSLGIARLHHIADVTQLAVTAKEDRWTAALDENFAIITDALHAPPSKDEIARELSNLRVQLSSGVVAESTVRSQQWAQQMVNAIDTGDVPVTAATGLALLDRLAPEMTPERVADATRALFGGSGPRLLLLSPRPVPGGKAGIAATLARAERMAPAGRRPERTVTIADLPALGPPGREVSRQHIEDLNATIVRFANGSTLTFKHTEFEKGSVAVELRFGAGMAGLSPTLPSLAWTSDVVTRSGLAGLDLDAMERLMTGRTMNLDFGVTEEAFVLAGSTNASDLPDELRLLATKLAFPRWDAALFDRFKAGWLESYDLSFASASSRAAREFGAVLHPGDQRWVAATRDDIGRATPEGLRAFFAPILATGPVEAIVVGDTDLDSAVAAAAKTVGALPVRPEPPAIAPAVPPRPNPAPRIFTHRGDPNQALALIGWSTIGGMDKIRERRALALAANMLKVRLFDRLREEAGATYAPSANSITSDDFPAWGVFVASAEVKPENTATFFKVSRELVADLAAHAAAPDEFARAQNPIVSGIERRLKSNAYWLSAMEDWPSDPRLIEQTRNYLSDYRSLTAEEVRAAVARFVADEGDWSMLVLPDKNETDGD